MSPRRISGLRWARPCPRPDCIPQGRPRGAKALGVRYEKTLAKALPAASHGQWFEFEDRQGHGWCQVDLMLERNAGIGLVEVKYTWTQEGHAQLELLYRPVVEAALDKSTVGVVACKALTHETPRRAIAASLAEAFQRRIDHGHGVWHWLPQAGLVAVPSLWPFERSLPTGHLGAAPPPG